MHLKSQMRIQDAGEAFAFFDMGSEYSVLVFDREWRSRTASRWRGERGAGP